MKIPQKIFSILLFGSVFFAAFNWTSYQEYHREVLEDNENRNFIMDVSLPGYLFGKIRFLLFPTESESLRKMLAQNDPHHLAISLSSAGDVAILETTHAIGRFDWSTEFWGLSCGIFPRETKVTQSWPFTSYVPVDINKAVAFNRMMVMTPDFPYPHICSIAGNGSYAIKHGVKDSGIEPYFERKEYLKDLGISEDEYKKRRLAVEKSSIYTASFFGHLDAVQTYSSDVNKCDGSYYPIHYAKAGNHPNAVDLLIRLGANPKNDTCIPFSSITF